MVKLPCVGEAVKGHRLIWASSKLPPKFRHFLGCFASSDFVYHGLCLKSKPWSCGHPVGGSLTDSAFNWTDENRHVCKACNWSRVVDCLMTVSWLSHDSLRILSRLSHDCLMTVSWLFLATIWRQLSGNFLVTFLQHSGHFLATFWQLSGNLLATFWRIYGNFLAISGNFLETFWPFFFCNFLATFWQLSCNFLATFWQLSGKFLAIFWQLSDKLFANFLATFWQCSGNFLATFWQLSGKFPATFWHLFCSF